MTSALCPALNAWCWDRTKWKITEGSQSLHFVVAESDSAETEYVITAGAAMARTTKKKRAEHTKKVKVFVSIPNDLLTSESTIQARTVAMDSEICELEALLPSAFETRAGPVSLFSGTMEIPVSTKTLRYQYWFRRNWKSKPQCEWYCIGQSKDACRVTDLSGSLIIDDEIMLERPGFGVRSDFPRVNVLQHRYTSWIWNMVQEGTLDVDGAVQYVNAACSGKKISHRYTNEVRGGKSTEELKRANEEELRRCAAETDDKRCTIACAALLARALHAQERSSARNSESKDLVLLYTFALNAWTSDRRSLARLSGPCRERVATGLVNSINVAHKRFDVDEQWMFALPLLHSVRDEPADHGISELLIRQRDASSNFTPVLDRLRPLFAQDPFLATSCFVAAPFGQALQVLSDLPSANLALRHWIIQVNRKVGQSRVTLHDCNQSMEATIECLQMLASMMQVKPQVEVPAIGEFLQQRAIVDSVSRNWPTGSKLIGPPQNPSLRCNWQLSVPPRQQGIYCSHLLKLAILGTRTHSSSSFPFGSSCSTSNFPDRP
eukprot:COSAG02_NODE_10270_length_1982_cov_1.131705_1_plen_550_part_00